MVELNNKPATDIVLFPNPFPTTFTIRQTGGMKNRSAVLSDAFGRVKQISLTSAIQTIDMSDLAPGVYILKMDDGTVLR